MLSEIRALVEERFAAADFHFFTKAIFRLLRSLAITCLSCRFSYQNLIQSAILPGVCHFGRQHVELSKQFQGSFFVEGESMMRHDDITGWRGFEF